MSLAIHRSCPLRAAEKYAPPPPGPWVVQRVGAANSVRDSITSISGASAQQRRESVRRRNNGMHTSRDGAEFLPLPVRRERVGVRAFWQTRGSVLEEGPHPTLSRRTGRGN